MTPLSFSNISSTKADYFLRFDCPEEKPIEKTLKKDIGRDLFRTEPEEGQKQSAKRRKYSYEKNMTISRRIEFDQETIPLSGVSRNEVVESVLKIPEVQDAIADHAFRRVLLFYYLAVVYYKTGCQISQGETNLQHGWSSTTWASAAHSCILPNVIDNFFDCLKKRLLREGLNPEIIGILNAIGVSSEQISGVPEGPLRKKAVDALLEGVDTKHGLLNSECSFYHNMNSTIELPEMVNRLDLLLEDNLRGEAVKLLNQVSQEGLHPYEALKLFVDSVLTFFSLCEEHTNESMVTLTAIDSLVQEVWVMEKNFTKEDIGDFLTIVKKIDVMSHLIKNQPRQTFPIRVETPLTWEKNFMYPDTKQSEKNYRKINNFISTKPNWMPKESEEPISFLENILKIAAIQKEYTAVPPYKLLSGKMKRGRLVPMSDSRLQRQKRQLIRRTKV